MLIQFQSSFGLLLFLFFLFILFGMALFANLAVFGSLNATLVFAFLSGLDGGVTTTGQYAAGADRQREGHYDQRFD